MTKLEKVKLALLAMQRYSWEQGTAMQAFLEAGDVMEVITMAREAAYRQTEDGRLAVIGDTGAVTDPCANGEGILYAYKETGEEELKKAHEKCMEWVMKKAPRNEDGIIYHLENEKQIWADSFYMLPPYLAAAGEYEEAVKQIRGYMKLLYCPEDKLLAHMWDDGKKKFARADHWGVGNGWALAGIARVIGKLPESMSQEKEELVEMENNLIDGLCRCVRDDGLFHDVVDDTGTFVETNCSQMLSYTLFRGMLEGWLEKSREAFAQRLRKAANGKVDAYGRVQGVCGAPAFDRAGSAPEGNAFYILMETAAKKYYRMKEEKV